MSLVPHVPARDEVHTRRKYAGLEDTYQHASNDENLPGVDLAFGNGRHAHPKHQEGKGPSNAELDECHVSRELSAVGVS